MLQPSQCTASWSAEHIEGIPLTFRNGYHQIYYHTLNCPPVPQCVSSCLYTVGLVMCRPGWKTDCPQHRWKHTHTHATGTAALGFLFSLQRALGPCATENMSNMPLDRKTIRKHSAASEFWILTEITRSPLSWQCEYKGQSAWQGGLLSLASWCIWQRRKRET